MDLNDNDNDNLEKVDIFYLNPVREESSGTVTTGYELLHVSLPDGIEAVLQIVLLCNNQRGEQ